jgi:steroid delta-isomerase-like uncharacterized protein
MSAHANKTLVRRALEDAFNPGNLVLVDALFASTFQLHDPAVPNLPTGPAAFKEVIRLYHVAFPDAQLTIEEQVAEGDRVVTRWTGRGTQRGELNGFPATGKQVTVQGQQLDRIVDGQIAESWVNYDALGMLQQLGAMPAPEQALQVGMSA